VGHHEASRMTLDYFFIIFAPGTAGNHLTNLISTDSRFAPRVNDTFYNNLTVNAHPTVENKTKFNLTQHVACYHLAQYLWIQDQVSKTLNNKRFLIIEFPVSTRNELFTNRILSLYPYYSNSYLIEELSTLYSVDSFKKLTGFTDVTPLSVDKIFNTDSTELVTYLHQNFDLLLDPTRIQAMHSKWISMIQKSMVDR
jgi:hypothetical protein